ncbi:MAG: 3-oxo-tetronate kinase [Pseudomonadota bacterium]
MKLGAIGDDFTGSSDLALMLSGASGEGLATVQHVGVPKHPAQPHVEAGVVALKSRTLPVAEAVHQSLEALEWLLAQGCEQVLFKVCSTFDSTPDGNIGPVAEALIRRLGTEDPVVVCPAFPATGRSVYQGHLFVGDTLLSESGLENHPLTPMTDPNIVRWLSLQIKGDVGLVSWPTVAQGPEAVRAALLSERDAGRQLVVCDAISNDDLITLAIAMKGFALAVCGSGLAVGMPAMLATDRGTTTWEPVHGRAVALAGSCSAATREQIAVHRNAAPVRTIEIDEVMTGKLIASDLADWALDQGGVPLIHSSDDPDAVRDVQARYGREQSADAIEALFGTLAKELVARGVSTIISAGGETSGAVVSALDAATLDIGPMIDPGVPAVAAQLDGRRIGLALKSGNFGAPDFFAKAARVLAGEA